MPLHRFSGIEFEKYGNSTSMKIFLKNRLFVLKRGVSLLLRVITPMIQPIVSPSSQESYTQANMFSTARDSRTIS